VKPFRILVNALTFLSLLMFVATVALWVRSYSVCDMFDVRFATTSPRVSTLPAGMALVLVKLSPDDGEMLDRVWWYTEPITGDWPRNALGFGFESLELGSRTMRAVIVPCWLVALLTAGLPLVSVWRRLQRRTANTSGLCPACGYDLRATPDRCPECGTIPAKA
jgi:hypothetical protein